MTGWRDRLRSVLGHPAETPPSTASFVGRVVSWLSPEESAALGHLPPEGIIGVIRGDALSADDFAPNATFPAFLQEQLRRVGPTLPSFRRDATAQGSGWLYVFDGRVEPVLRADPGAEVPLEDILGGFEVVEGRITEDRYWANPDHALLGARGLCVIPRDLRPAMLDALRSRS